MIDGREGRYIGISVEAEALLARWTNRWRAMPRHSPYRESPSDVAPRQNSVSFFSAKGGSYAGSEALSEGA